MLFRTSVKVGNACGGRAGAPGGGGGGKGASGGKGGRRVASSILGRMKF